MWHWEWSSNHWGGLPLHLSHRKNIEAESPSSRQMKLWFIHGMFCFEISIRQFTIVFCCQSLLPLKIPNCVLHIISSVYQEYDTMNPDLNESKKNQKTSCLPHCYPLTACIFRITARLTAIFPAESSNPPGLNSRCLTGQNTEIKWLPYW